MKKVFAALLALFVSILSACSKEPLSIPVQSQPVIQKQAGMGERVHVIKNCVDEGLSEQTCSAVYQQMVTGNVQGSSTLAQCEQQYGAGNCSSVPMRRADGQTETSFLPLLVAAAIGYMAANMFSSNTVPHGAMMPSRQWAESKIYTRGQQQTLPSAPALIAPPVTKPKTSQPAKQSDYASSDGYNKNVTVNGQQLPTSSNVPKLTDNKQVVPSVTPKPSGQVTYSQPSSAYSQPMKPAPAPTVTVRPSTQTTTTTRRESPSRSSDRRR
jgi:uncharacterized protein YgiB involved in biofilm formation